MDASSPSTSKIFHQTHLKKYFNNVNNGHDLTAIVETEPKKKNLSANPSAEETISSDEENLPPLDTSKNKTRDDDENYRQRLRNQPRKIYHDEQAKLKQTLIDVGQKPNEAIVCKRCGMAYFPHSAEDKAAHTKYHNYTTSSIRLRNFKSQQILQQFLDGSIYMIGCTSPTAEQKKAETIREWVDQELGITTPFNCLWSESKAYFYVEDSTDIVLGYCLAHIVHRVHWLDLNDDSTVDPKNEIDKMLCGIARIWVHPDHRRARIATKLLDCVRTNFFFGIIIKRVDLAFSAPTDEGRRLFKSYTKSNRLFVY